MKRSGYTLLELVVVIGIIGIVLSVVGLRIWSNASREVDMILSDLRFARTYAVSSQESVQIHFDKDADGYQILSNEGTVLKERALQHVDLVSFHWISPTQTVYATGAYEKCGHIVFTFLGETYRLNFTVGIADVTVGNP